MNRYIPTDVMSPLSLGFSPRAGIVALRLLMYSVDGEGAGELVSAVAFMGKPGTHFNSIM